MAAASDVGNVEAAAVRPPGRSQQFPGTEHEGWTTGPPPVTFPPTTQAYRRHRDP